MHWWLRHYSIETSLSTARSLSLFSSLLIFFPFPSSRSLSLLLTLSSIVTLIGSGLQDQYYMLFPGKYCSHVIFSCQHRVLNLSVVLTYTAAAQMYSNPKTWESFLFILITSTQLISSYFISWSDQLCPLWFPWSSTSLHFLMEEAEKDSWMMISNLICRRLSSVSSLSIFVSL